MVTITSHTRPTPPIIRPILSFIIISTSEV
jgi:hypothetical protein